MSKGKCDGAFRNLTEREVLLSLLNRMDAFCKWMESYDTRLAAIEKKVGGWDKVFDSLIEEDEAGQ